MEIVCDPPKDLGSYTFKSGIDLTTIRKNRLRRRSQRISKWVLLIICTLFLGVSLEAQDYQRALGLRAGVPYGISYKQTLKRHRGVEIFAGTRWTGGITFAAIGLKHFQTNIYPGVLLFAGVGPEAGFWNEGSSYLKGQGAGWAFGISFSAGAEYQFDNIPLTAGLDWFPIMNILARTVFDAGRIGISLRYLF